MFCIVLSFGYIFASSANGQAPLQPKNSKKMATTLTKHERNLSAIIHASMFAKYFFPFGTFILPLILWMSNKKQYAFVDYNGKQALNFQISILLYSIVAGLISIPFFVGALPHMLDWDWGGFSNLEHLNWWGFKYRSDGFQLGHWIWPVGITGLVQLGLGLVNIVFSILATIRTSEGEYFKYPFSIAFIK